jgi:hypothetical protein
MSGHWSERNDQTRAKGEARPGTGRPCRVVGVFRPGHPCCPRDLLHCGNNSFPAPEALLVASASGAGSCVHLTALGRLCGAVRAAARLQPAFSRFCCAGRSRLPCILFGRWLRLLLAAPAACAALSAGHIRFCLCFRAAGACHALGAQLVLACSLPERVP